MRTREEATVGDQGRGRRLIIDELVGHRQRETQPGMTPLEAAQSSRYTHFSLSRLNDGEATK
ncbi:MAG: hypothetical protein QOH09_3832 [Pseudonocardiales bacterium]|jgi:methylphosphotriester-DNA--protein-cysteine methyltransferase|nr:hypothetical protein [Pseudonocardiales bacterium]